MQSAEFADYDPLGEGELLTEAETRGFYSDILPLSPGEQDLLDMVVYIHEKRQPFREDFRLALQNNLRTCIDPEGRRSMEVVGSTLEWLLFALPGEEFPEGAAFNRDNDLVYVDRHIQSVKSSVTSHIYSDGQMIEVMKDVRATTFGSEKDFADSLDKIAQERPIYQLLYTLANEDYGPKDLPLSMAQRLIRESQIAEDITRTFGLNPTNPLSQNPGARLESWHRLSRLDEETLRRPEVENADPKQRLMEFIVGQLNEIGGSDLGHNITGLRTHNMCMLATMTNGMEIDISSEIPEMLRSVTRRINGDKHMLEQGNFLIRVTQNLANPVFANHSAGEIIELSGDPHSLSDVFFSYQGYARPIVLATLLKVNAPIVETVSMPEQKWFSGSMNTFANVISEELLEINGTEVTGMVFDYSNSSTNHMILKAGVHKTLPEQVDEFDLLFVAAPDTPFYANGSTFINLPYIPGFILSAHDKDAYYFTRSEVDSYEGSALVDVELDRINALAEECEMAGYTQLAERLKSKDNWSLHDVVKSIKDTSDYTFDEERKLALGNTGLASTDISKLIDVNGRLQVQCTGAGAFTRYALESLFPDSVVVVLGPGHPIASDGHVEGNTHAQVLISLDGEQYIVDSTPSRETDALEQDTYEKQAQTRRKKASPEKQDGDFTNNNEVVGSTIMTERDRSKQYIEAAPARLNRLLKAQFRLPETVSDKEMRKHVARLRERDDPVRRVVSLTLQGQSGYDVSSELADTVKYIERLMRADKRTIRQIGIPHYNEVLLTALRDTAVSLSFGPGY